jgi:hypothetical protein
MLWKLAVRYKCAALLIGETFPIPPLLLYSWGGKLDFGIAYEIRWGYSQLPHKGSHNSRFPQFLPKDPILWLVVPLSRRIPRRKIRLIESKTKCRYLKRLACKGILRQMFFLPEAPSPPMTSYSHSNKTRYTYTVQCTYYTVLYS